MPEPDALQTETATATAVAPSPVVPVDDEDAGVSAKPRWGIGFFLALTWLIALVLVLAVTPALPIDDPNTPSADLFLEPGGEALFGTDELGRDMFSRVLWGGRQSLTIGFSALILGFIGGGLIGITAGYFGGTYERLIMAAMDIMLSFPSLILALALIAALSEPGTQEGSFGKLVTVLTILAVPALARITRANTLVYSRREFVTAARSLGARNGRILIREILPNVLPSMLSFAFIALAILIIAEGALAFLGLSVEAPAVTWGKLIELGRGDLDQAAYLALIPCGFLFLTLLSLNLIGDKLQARFAVREGQV
jgi:peptide/nickel transport system permease protein